MAEPVGIGIIGGGLMGRELTSATARWLHLLDPPATPTIAAVCDVSPAVLDWYRRLDRPPNLYSDYGRLLEDPGVAAVYVATPHHLHEEIFVAALRAGRHLMGEKPFGIDRAANRAINAEVAAHPELSVCCSSEFPFFPGGKAVADWIRDGRYERILAARCRFLHSSDLDPKKPINWKRRSQFNGEYGCMGDLGIHALHLPLRAGWVPDQVYAVLSDVFTTRPDADGNPAPCDTWDNATLLGTVGHPDGYGFPLELEMKRIAPGEMNTWTIEVDGTRESIAYTTKRPKTLRRMAYSPGGEQTWSETDLGSQSAYPTITGAIFESGFSDAILQMWAAYLDQLVNGRDGMRQPFHCATAEEAALSHAIFDAALESDRLRSAAPVEVESSPVADPS